MLRAFTSRAPTIFIALLVCSFLSSCNSSSPQASCASWQIVPSPNPGNVADELRSVFALASNDIWAAGTAADTSTSNDNRTLIEHWDGKSWRVVANPNSSPELDGYPTLEDWIAGSSASNLWVVGNEFEGFTEHWDGQGWQAVDFPRLPASVYSNTFRSVSVLSPNETWVVGSTMLRAPTRGAGEVALTTHWDGHVWSIVPSPDLHANLNGTSLYSVVALAPDNVWAVGSTSSSAHSQLALIEHWNGKRWDVVPSPQPQGVAITAAATLFSLSARSPNDIWAAGFYASVGATHSLVEHWDGHAWNLVPISVPAKPLKILYQITAISDHDIWVLDSDGALFHWDGHAWSPSTLPGASQHRYIFHGIAALPNGKLWLVGTINDPTGPGPRTLIATSCP